MKKECSIAIHFKFNHPNRELIAENTTTQEKCFFLAFIVISFHKGQVSNDFSIKTNILSFKLIQKMNRKWTTC